MGATTPDPTRDAKRALRAQVLAARDALPAAERAAASLQLTDQALGHPVLATAGTVLGYASIGSEVETAALLSACLRRGQRLLLPRVNRALRCLDLYFVRDLSADLAPGTWDIREPRPERCEQLHERAAIDAVIVPGAAFTPDCARMGYGGGFYDRLLAQWPGRNCFIALAFDVQIVEALPLNDTDVLMHEVITPTRVFSRAS